MAWRQELQRLVTAGEIKWDEPMSRQTSFRIGGPVDALVIPGTREELRRVIDFAEANALPCLILGRGTNLLVKDGGLRGLAVKAGSCLGFLRIDGEEIAAGAGISLIELANAAAARGLAGLAFAAGIPGTLGGGVYMNAGAYGGEMSQVVLSVTAYYPGSGARTHALADLGLGYRTSRFQAETAIIEEVLMGLKEGDAESIRAEMAEYSRRRQEKQPLHQPSAGSVFKRQPGCYAGNLIEQAGLKGMQIGQAQVSPLHANFIVNLGGASAADVLNLIRLVQLRVKEKTGIELEPELKVVGEDAAAAAT